MRRIHRPEVSELLKVSVGDTFFLDGDVRGDVTVAGIYEHYTGHFIYMTPGYYENALHADGEPNAYLLNFTSDDTDTCNAIFEKLLDMSGVATTSRMRDTQDTYMHSMERVDFVVVIIILAAAALAMVVLFNLSNINITERQRELATIKLLAFTTVRSRPMCIAKTSCSRCSASCSAASWATGCTFTSCAQRRSI